MASREARAKARALAREALEREANPPDQVDLPDDVQTGSLPTLGYVASTEQGNTLPISSFNVVVPALKHPLISPAQRVHLALTEWIKLQDPYLANIVAEGLKLDWVEYFDPENPDKRMSPGWQYAQEELPPEVDEIIDTWLKQGILTVVPEELVKACSPIFAIPKKGIL